MTKKKVCIIHNGRLLDARSFYKQGRSLKNAGYDVSIIGFFERNESINGINLIGLRSPDKRFMRFIISNFLFFTKSLQQKADVYHFHDLDFVPWAVMLKIITRKKVIYDIHEAHPEFILLKTYIPKIFRKLLSQLIYIMEHIAIHFFDAITPNDNYIAEGFSHKNNVVIYNFPTLDFFNSSKEIIWQERNYDLFYHGTLSKHHFKLMMDVAEKLNADKVKNTWGIIMTKTSPKEWIMGEVEKRHLVNNFTFLPYSDYLNIAKYLSDAKIGIIPLPALPKFMKNIPLKLFEFMGMGMPAVLSDLPPSRQFIKGENCAIPVEPDNVNEYAEAIKLLLSDPEKSAEMGNNGKKLIFQRLNWSTEEKNSFVYMTTLWDSNFMDRD